MQKRLKCGKCGFITAINKLGDSRFYCIGCGRNLGCRIITDRERGKEKVIQNEE